MSEAKFEINCGIKYQINLFDVVRSGEPTPQKVVGDVMSYIVMKPIYHENGPITFVPIDNHVKNIECVQNIDLSE
tara:strand:- start:720 stop:944 length:225 start_codon:yes stop_codon:yes gene_type:complete